MVDSVGDVVRSRLQLLLDDAPPRRAAEDEPAPEAAMPQRRFDRRHVVVLLCVLLLGVAFTGYWFLTARAVEIPPAPEPIGTVGAQPPSATAATPAVPGPTASNAPAASIAVHVLGAVGRPGVVTLPAGSRVADALKAAGGLTADAAPGELNLAAPVPDGAQIVVGDRAHPRGEVRTVPAPAPTAQATPAGSAPSATAAVDLNTATLEQLDALDGVGPVMAQRILEWRTAHGRFTRVEELQEIDGIGAKTYQRLAAQVRV